MKHSSCASWCNWSSATASGWRGPENTASGCSVTRVTWSVEPPAAHGTMIVMGLVMFVAQMIGYLAMIALIGLFGVIVVVTDQGRIERPKTIGLLVHPLA